jgi:hypothetical protein
MIRRIFAGRSRSELDLAAISEDITRTANAAMHPTRSAVWLRKSSRPPITPVVP